LLCRYFQNAKAAAVRTIAPPIPPPIPPPRAASLEEDPPEDAGTGVADDEADDEANEDGVWLAVLLGAAVLVWLLVAAAVLEALEDEEAAAVRFT
jgi:hypothetical protein